MTTTDPRNRRPVLHDPLLDGVPPAPPAPPRATREPRKSKHPALSARILATGLATTGTLGLTAGYAFSAPAKNSPAPATDALPATQAVPGGTTGANPDTTVPGADQPGAAASTPRVTAPPAPPAASDVTVAPPVVELQIPEIAPANPGSGGGGQNAGNQQSSGSN